MYLSGTRRQWNIIPYFTATSVYDASTDENIFKSGKGKVRVYNSYGQLGPDINGSGEPGWTS